MKILSKRDYSILIGNAVDHFDTALYGFLAPIFAKLFFPNTDPTISLILAYSVFASTIITRPLGSYIFGVMAMAYGPALSLSYSLIGVGISTLAIGFLPTYEDVGCYAPILLIIFRFLGGIFSSGEITIARLYILANKEKTIRFKISYLYQTSVMFGIVLASLASTIILKSHIEYWRIGFIIGGIAALFGYMLRFYNNEILTLNTKQLLSLYSSQTLKTLCHNKGLLLTIAITSGFSYMTYCVPFIIMNNLVPEFTNLSLEELMPSNTILLVVDMILLPIIGFMFIKCEVRKTLYFSAIILAFTIIPIWYQIIGSSFYYIIFIKIWIIIIGIIFSNIINIWYDDLITQDAEKYFLVGIGSSLGSAIIGKMAPSFCFALYYYSKSPFSTAWFITIVSICTTVAIVIRNSKSSP